MVQRLKKASKSGRPGASSGAPGEGSDLSMARILRPVHLGGTIPSLLPAQCVVVVLQVDS
jgi:hypothetical protein